MKTAEEGEKYKKNIIVRAPNEVNEGEEDKRGWWKCVFVRSLQIDFHLDRCRLGRLCKCPQEKGWLIVETEKSKIQDFDDDRGHNKILEEQVCLE